MATLGRMIVEFGGDDRDLNRTFDRVERRTRSVVDSMDRVGASLTLGATVPLAALGGASIRAAASLDSVRRGFEATAGSAEVAGLQIARLNEIAKLPSVDFGAAARTSVAFQSIGGTAEFAERAIKGVANAVTLSGGGQEQFGNVIRQLTQVASKGKLAGEELTSMLESAPAMAGAFQAAFGTTSAEAIRKLDLTAEEFFEKLFTGLETLPQVSGGLQSSLENLGASATRALASLSGGDIDHLAGVIDNVAESVEHAALVFANLDPSTRKVVYGVAALAFAAGPASTALATLSRGVVGLHSVLASLAVMPSRVSTGLATLSATATATQTALTFNRTAGEFSTASGIILSRSAAMQVQMATTATTAGVLTGAIRGVISILTGPVGLAIALTTAIGLFGRYKLAQAEAAAGADEFKTSLLGLDEDMLVEAAASIDNKITALEATRSRLEAQARRVSEVETLATGEVVLTGRVKTVFPQGYDETVAQIEELTNQYHLVETQIGKVRAAASELDETDFPDAPPVVDTGALSAAEAAFKNLTSQVREYRAAAAVGLSTVADLPEELARVWGLVDTARQRVEGVNQAIADLAKAGKAAPAGLAEMLRVASAEAANLERHYFNIADRLLEIGRTPVQVGMVAVASLPAIPPVLDSMVNRAAIFDERLNDANVSARSVVDTLGDLALALRGFEGLANPFGGLGDSASDAIHGIAGIVDGLRAIQDSADAITEIPSLTGLLSGGLGIAGGVASLVAPLITGFFSDTVTPLEQALDRNRDALDKLRLDLSGFSLTFGRQADIGKALQAVESARVGSGNVRQQFGTKDSVDAFLQRFGLSLGQVAAAAERFGIEVYDKKGNVILDALQQLGEALRLSALSITNYAASLEGRGMLLDARREIYDDTDPNAALRDAFSLLSAGLSDSLEARLGLVGLDLSGVQGRGILEDALRELISQATAGTLDASMLSGFESVDEFISHLLTTDKALDAFADTASKAADALTNVPPLFDRALRTMQAARIGAGAGGGLPLADPSPLTPRIGGNTYNFTMQGGSAPEATNHREIVRRWIRDLENSGDPDARALALVMRVGVN